MMPGGTFKNKEFRLGRIEFSLGVDPLIQDIRKEIDDQYWTMFLIRSYRSVGLVLF